MLTWSNALHRVEHHKLKFD